MTGIELTSLHILENVIFGVPFIVNFCVCKHNMPCTLEINSNGGFKRE